MPNFFSQTLFINKYSFINTQNINLLSKKLEPIFHFNKKIFAVNQKPSIKNY